MNFIRNIATGSLLLLVVLTVASCGDRQERQNAARERQGLARVEAVEQEVLSPGAQLYRDKTCNTCHGDDGVKTLLPNYPTIARQGEAYALKQMRDIKSGDRNNSQSAAMKPIIDQVSDEELVLLAQYIANELGQDAPIGGTPDPESAGAKLYQTKTCTACHGADGKTPLLPEYAKVAGHNAEYIKQQLLDIKSGARANGVNVAGMKGIMHLVSEEEIDQLAEYVATLPR